jgi:manganese/zinc/iron transport system permease protein
MSEVLQLDLVPLATLCLAAISAALVGSVQLLRRQSLAADAASHVALPGIVVGFLATGTTDAWAMLSGALLAALLAALATHALQRFGIEASAALGAVFTTFFAGGVVLLELTGAGAIHLDVRHVLFGAPETLVWLAGTDLSALTDPAALAELPPALPRLALTGLAIAVLMALAFKEIRAAAFDPVHAGLAGLRPRLVTMGLALASAAAAVFAFEAVGAILVVALFVCGPAAARLLTDELRTHVLLSVAIALGSALVGYLAATRAPGLFGLAWTLPAGPAIAVCGGLAVALSALLAGRRAASPLRALGTRAPAR